MGEWLRYMGKMLKKMPDKDINKVYKIALKKYKKGNKPIKNRTNKKRHYKKSRHKKTYKKVKYLIW